MSERMRRGRIGRVAAGLVCLVVWTGLGGCGAAGLFVEKPQVKSLSVAVVKADFRKVDLRFDVEVINSGSGSLTVVGYDYDLRVDGRPFLAGRSETGFELKPHAATTLSVPLSIPLAELLRKGVGLLTRPETDYRLAIGLDVETSFGTVRVPFEKEGRLVRPTAFQ